MKERTTKKAIGKQGYVKPFTRLIVALGALVCILAANNLPVARLDLRFALLFLITILFGSRLTIQVPRAKVHYSLSDTLIFLVLLLYGGEAAILLAAAEALYTSLRLKKNGTTIRRDTILFNSALTACSTFLTVLTLRLCFGPIGDLSSHNSGTLISLLGVMALVQYIASTSLAAFYTACEANAGIWITWNSHYFCTSITYFAGAAAAGVLAKLTGQIGSYAVIFTTIVIAMVYLTYDRYIQEIKATAEQAEQAERARAEQAEQHVEQLNHHIVEQERISIALQESKEHFRHAAFHDALTSLPNRASLTEELKAAIEHAKQSEDFRFALLFLDLDRFKNVNDSLGHPIGDQLLVAIALRLRQCTRGVDIVARLGGDEFAILLNGIDNCNDTIPLAERIQKELAMPFKLSGHEVFTTASIGIALNTTGYDCPDNILRDADTAMYRAKAQGNAGCEVFDKTMHARAVNLLKLETDLRLALERKEFCIHYQPIVWLETGELHGFEALVRWQHPELGLIYPTEFIPIAEETGLISQIGLWVLREACRQARRWTLEFPDSKPLVLSVNLSGKQLMQPDVVAQVQRILKETHLDPRFLKLEVTESAVMENAEAAINLLTQLRSLGVRLSIDDFGTGYSSLSYLHQFPIDTLKIDRSFVDRIGLNRIGIRDTGSEIIRTIVSLADNMGLDVVAEGVETPEQLTKLLALKVRYGQGFLFSKALDAEATETLLAQGCQWQAGAVA